MILNVFLFPQLGQGSGGQKGGIQYINDAFENDEDGDGLKEGKSVENEKSHQVKVNEPHYDSIVASVAPLSALLADDSSLAGSDMASSEKEVKPILTKERRSDEGYKSVWFKEDIDPDAKEEVVIIPREQTAESREHDSEEEDEDNNSVRMKTQKVGFTDSDLDSGVSVKIGDQTVSSDDEEGLNVDL